MYDREQKVRKFGSGVVQQGKANIREDKEKLEKEIQEMKEQIEVVVKKCRGVGEGGEGVICCWN